MRELNIAICDDEKTIREQIREWIEKEMQGQACDMFATGDELLAVGKQFDIVFLDIQMDGRNGIETAGILKERKEETIVIFITGTKEYVLEAFDVSAFHYLLKPIEESRFRQVFYRAVKELEKRKRQIQEPVFIKIRNRNITLHRDNIFYVESRAKKVAIHTTMEVIEVYASMNELERQLGNGFYRCHRGYLVNLAYITEYNSESIILSNGEHIYLAKERYSEFVKTYMRYLRNGVCADA